MATLPPSTDFTGSGVTEGGFKTAISTLRTFIADLFGTDGTAATARSTLGARGVADDVILAAGKKIIYEGTTDDAYKLMIDPGDPTADITQTHPNYGGTFKVMARGADIASAATINLTTATGDIVDVTGTTGITAITLADGMEKTVRFTGALTLTNGASLVLPGAANITTASGDFAVFRGYAAGVVRCVSYQKANGNAVVAPSTGAGTVQAWVNFNGTGTVAIRASGNVSSITDNGTGDYTVNFTSALADANYAASAMDSETTTGGPAANITAMNAGSFQFLNQTYGAGAGIDPVYMLVTIVR